MSFVIRTDGDARLGMGHVKRCLSLAPSLDGPVVFALRHTSPAVLAMIREQGHACRTVKGDIANEPNALRQMGGDRGIVLDISHPETMRQADAMPAYVEALKPLFPVIGLIDGMGPDSLSGRAAVDADVTVVPYVGAKAGTHGAWLTGPQYFILAPEYRSLGEREVRNEASRVLITAGGSDPAGITPRALDALNEMTDRDLQVRVAVGPDFSKTLGEEIAAGLRAAAFAADLLSAPSSLLDHMVWCDVCISASGLTKYELAATGTPALLISPDRRLADANRGFAGTGAAIDLGIAEVVTSAEMAAALGALLDDPRRRARMAAHGRALLDGRGARRIADALGSARR